MKEMMFSNFIYALNDIFEFGLMKKYYFVNERSSLETEKKLQKCKSELM